MLRPVAVASLPDRIECALPECFELALRDADWQELVLCFDLDFLHDVRLVPFEQFVAEVLDWAELVDEPLFDVSIEAFLPVLERDVLVAAAAVGSAVTAAAAAAAASATRRRGRRVERGRADAVRVVGCVAHVI